MAHYMYKSPLLLIINVHIIVFIFQMSSHKPHLGSCILLKGRWTLCYRFPDLIYNTYSSKNVQLTWVWLILANGSYMLNGFLLLTVTSPQDQLACHFHQSANFFTGPCFTINRATCMLFKTELI